MKQRSRTRLILLTILIATLGGRARQSPTPDVCIPSNATCPGIFNVLKLCWNIGGVQRCMRVAPGGKYFIGWKMKGISDVYTVCGEVRSAPAQVGGTCS